MAGSRSPFREDVTHSLLFHSCHHKCGTHWLKRILKGIARRYGIPLNGFREGDPLPTEGILFDQQSRVDTSQLVPYRGSHMVRDPRDVVVSGYFYHLWTKEEWVHKPQERFAGRTYQQHLQSLNLEAGLIAEIEVSSFVFKQMRRWNYGEPNVIELKYESCFSDSVESFEPLFRHYGLNDDAVEFGLNVVNQSTFEAVTRRKCGEVQEGQVTRSGQPGQWREHFTDRVKEQFRAGTNGLLHQLGYEPADDW